MIEAVVILALLPVALLNAAIGVAAVKALIGKARRRSKKVR